MTATLILVFEPAEACRERLLAEGFDPVHAGEIASYLDQSTDIAPHLEAIAEACDARGLAFRPVELDDAPAELARFAGERALVWTLTDGIAYFRGGAGPTLARLNGLGLFGSDDALFALCQDKFRSGATMRALGLPAPDAGLARNGEWLAAPPAAPAGYFVKPNRLGAKIGIWADSHCETEAQALALSRRIFAAYRDDAIVQAYVPGRNVRASFLAADPTAGMDRLGVSLVDSGGDFQTMADSLALYGDTGARAAQDGRRAEPALQALARSQPEADRAIRDFAAQAARGLGLADVFSMDWRVDETGAVRLLEFEVCPGLPCFDFVAYCREVWTMGLAPAMAEAAARKLAARP